MTQSPAAPATPITNYHLPITKTPILLITPRLPHDISSLAHLLDRNDLHFTLCPPDEVAAKLPTSPLSKTAAALIVLPPDTLHTSAPHVIRLLDTLAEKHLPALLLTYTHTDAQLAREMTGDDPLSVITTDASPDELAGRLLGLAASRPLTTALHSENAALRQCELGIQSRMAQLDEELRLAARLQSDFLPHPLPTFPGAAFDVFFRPASYVSGDFYDVARLDEHHVGFFIADAVGHGMPAALLTIFIKQALKTKELLPDHKGGGYRVIPPDEALFHLNNELITQNLSAGQFVTMAYAILNTHTLQLQWSRAGHPAPILLRPDASATDLDLDGALLGIFPDEQFPSQSLQLSPGDALLLYSDGFESAFTPPNAPNEFINDQYRSHFAALAGQNPRAAFAKMITTLDTQPGSLHPRDDLTALLLTITPDR